MNAYTPSLPGGTLVTAVPAVNTPNLDLVDRRHRLGPRPNLLGRLALCLKDWLEHRVAAASLQGDPMVYDPEDFPWVREVEADWPLIRRELDAVMPFRDKIPSFHEILKEASSITTDDNWKTYFLSGIGMDCRENAKRCPETMRLLAKIPGAKTAFFSILSPHKHIPPHRGAFNGVLRFHLGLMVPEPRAKVRIRIGNQVHSWIEGRSLVFDDTFNHEVWNDTEGYRVVLFVDFARPMRGFWGWLNNIILNASALAPFLREAGEKQKNWERMFYSKDSRNV